STAAWPPGRPRARGLPGGQAAVLDRRAAVFLLLRLGLERPRGLARILTGATRDLVGLLQASGQLLDQEPFVETHCPIVSRSRRPTILRDAVAGLGRVVAGVEGGNPVRSIS